MCSVHVPCAAYLFLFGSRAIDIVVPNDNRMDEVLKTYFTKGYSYDKILQLLAKYHETHISLRTLQQKLYNLGLKRRNINYDREEVRQAIIDHCDGPGSSNGYRSVWHALRLKGICVPRRVVADILREVDPEGRLERRAKRMQRRRCDFMNLYSILMCMKNIAVSYK